MGVPIPPLTFTVLLSQAAVDRLTLLKTAYNAEAGTALTLTDWITLHLRELAINAEWSASVQALQRQLELDVQAAVRGERTRLLGTV